MVFDSLSLSDRPAPIQVDANGVEEGEDCNDGEGASDREGDWCRLGAEVEESGSDCANVNGELKLQKVSSH